MTSVRVLAPGDASDVDALLRSTAGPLEVGVLPDTGALAGWVARDEHSALIGVILDVPGRPGDGRAGEWVALEPGVLAALYAVAAEGWMSRGVATHRVVLAAGDGSENELIDLGFGHQQAYGSVLAADLGAPVTTSVIVTEAGAAELPELTELVPLVSRRQALSPVFAPRTAEFFAQLPQSMEEFVTDDGTAALLARDDHGSAVGFCLLEAHEVTTEIVLAGTVAARRGGGVGRSLVASAARWAQDRGHQTLITDWRTTNPGASRFWRSVGMTVDAYRWSRTIDATPD